MASINPNTGCCQTNSNVVIFEMMNFYKRKLEESEEENAMLRDQLKKAKQEHMHDIHTLENQLNNQVNMNMIFAQTNLAQAETVQRKHQAGIRLARCFDELAAAVELVEETHIGGDEALALRYVYMKKEEIMQRANVGIQMLIAPSPQEPEVIEMIHFERIEREIIDLTEDTQGETTEEEEESESE